MQQSRQKLSSVPSGIWRPSARVVAARFEVDFTRQVCRHLPHDSLAVARCIVEQLTGEKSEQRPLPVILRAVGQALRGAAFFAGIGCSAAICSAVIGRINCASSLATRLTASRPRARRTRPRRGADQQRHRRLRIVDAAIEPALEIAGRDRHGHAVMQHGEIGARRRGDDRHRIEFLAVRADPGFRQRRQGRSARRRGDG